MEAGKLNQRITIQSQTITQSDSGEPVESYTDFLTLWAQVKTFQGKESFVDASKRAFRTNFFVIRWVDGILPNMRIYWQNVYWRIVYVDGIDRRGFITLTAEAIL